MCLSPAVGQSETFTPRHARRASPRRRRTPVGELRRGGEDAQRVELGQRDTIGRAPRGVRGEVHHAPAHAVALGQGPRPLHGAGGHVSRPRRSGHAPIRPLARPCTVSSIASFSRRASAIVSASAPAVASRPPADHARMPTASTTSATTATSKSVPASPEGRRPGPDRLDAGEEADTCSSSAVVRGTAGSAGPGGTGRRGCRRGGGPGSGAPRGARGCPRSRGARHGAGHR